MFLIRGDVTVRICSQLLIVLLITTSHRRRSIQFHYAASECKTTKCPKESEQARDRVESPLQEQSTEATQKPRYFNCDPSCKEAFHWHLTKAELLVCGKEFDNHI